MELSFKLATDSFGDTYAVPVPIEQPTSNPSHNHEQPTTHESHFPAHTNHNNIPASTTNSHAPNPVVWDRTMLKELTPPTKSSLPPSAEIYAANTNDTNDTDHTDHTNHTTLTPAAIQSPHLSEKAFPRLPLPVVHKLDAIHNNGSNEDLTNREIEACIKVLEKCVHSYNSDQIFRTPETFAYVRSLYTTIYGKSALIAIFARRAAHKSLCFPQFSKYMPVGAMQALADNFSYLPEPVFSASPAASQQEMEEAAPYAATAHFIPQEVAHRIPCPIGWDNDVNGSHTISLQHFFANNSVMASPHHHLSCHHKLIFTQGTFRFANRGVIRALQQAGVPMLMLTATCWHLIFARIESLALHWVTPPTIKPRADKGKTRGFNL